MSRSRKMDSIAVTASPEAIAQAARREGCTSVAYTYNDPVIFLEYVEDTAIACAEQGVKSVAVTAGYISERARPRFFRHIDAANVDLKAFSERFYRKLCGGHLGPVLDTLRYLAEETSVWLELTTLLIPGENDSSTELDEMTRWVVDNLGRDVPMHFTAFHPDWKLLDRPATPVATLLRAREIAMANGVRFAYTGNVHDGLGGSSWCPECGARVIERDW
jgi:pyruvate formate lyase activating enzyme